LQNFNVELNLMNNPSGLSSDQSVSILSGMWFFQTCVLNKITVDENTTVEQVTQIVNGGTNGLSTRQSYFNAVQGKVPCN